MAPLLLLLVTATAWVAATRKGPTRGAATVATILLLVLTVAVVLTAEDHGVTLIVTLALLAASTLLVRYALRRDRRGLGAQPVPGSPVDRRSAASSS